MKNKLHIFAVNFQSRKHACKYTEAKWEPEPDDSASDEEFEEWEERNPIWELEFDLNGEGFLDSDSIETVTGKTRLAYVTSHLKSATDIESVENDSTGMNTFVLIFPGALHSLGGYKCKMKDTSQLKYLGAFKFNFPN
ncbi:hypothetical protein [Mariniblastus fucicola]|uniref:Uncharacterized protein n=1 Tax=Mariniblastus fucicola TaxID=980251 RepID=A0A5B9PAP7_9BACT|nr:hypothetical protein [Mariniblastus fucicola]QEG22010.1 hypothetical protein MFFC18_18710 [Mariniblastus fucicola]